MDAAIEAEFAAMIKAETDEVRRMIESQDFEAYYQLVSQDKYLLGMLGFCYALLYGKDATSPAQLEESFVIKLYNRKRSSMIASLKQTSQRIIEVQEQQRKSVSDALKHKFRTMNKPSEHGTVAEIAARYGISKSEVRKRRAAGTLDELINGGTT